jgi:hypothetical protein
LAQTLSKNHDLFPAVEQLDSGDFFERNGLLYQAPDDVRKSAEGLARAQPFIVALAGDPSLRGVMTALWSAIQGVQAGQIKMEQLAWPLSLTDQTLGDVLSVKPATFPGSSYYKASRCLPSSCGTSSEFSPRWILPRFSPD